MLIGFGDGDLVFANAIVNSHGEIGNSGKGGDEGSQDVKQAFLLRFVRTGKIRSIEMGSCCAALTTGTRNAIA